MSLKSKLLAATAGINWQVFLIKWGAIAAVFVACLYVAYNQGKTNCQVTTAQAAQTEAEQKVVYVTKEVEKRIPEIQIIDKASAKQKAEVAVLKAQLKDAIDASQSNPSCDLSDDEFRLFNELADKTQR